MANRYAAALMHHVMRRKLAKQKQIIEAALAGRRSASQPDAEDAGIVEMTETRVYVGLNDAETREQKFETEKYVNTLKDICKTYHVAFSMDIEEGGYYHEDGAYTEETSLVLVLIDADRDVVQKIAQDLRTAFHQESVLVTEDRISGCFVVEEASD